MKTLNLVIGAVLLIVALGIGYKIITTIISAKREQAMGEAVGGAMEKAGGFMQNLMPKGN